jgi:hypothetical protein
VRATGSDADRPSYAATPELAWLVLWLTCVGVIVAFPAWQVVPLDASWISLAVLYGIRIWPSRRLLVLTALGVAVTIAVLCDDMITRPRVVGGPVSQVPLLATLVVVMAWQARRWFAADRHMITASKCVSSPSSVNLATSTGQRPSREDGSA